MRLAIAESSIGTFEEKLDNFFLIGQKKRKEYLLHFKWFFSRSFWVENQKWKLVELAHETEVFKEFYNAIQLYRNSNVTKYDKKWTEPSFLSKFLGEKMKNVFKIYLFILSNVVPIAHSFNNLRYERN